MARQITEGGEGGDAVFFELSVNSQWTNTASTSHIEGRSFTTSSNNGGYKLLPTAVSEFYIRFALNNRGIKFGWFNGATELGSFRFNTSSVSYDLYTGASTLVGSGVNLYAGSIWQVIEVHVKIADSGGIIEYKVDGVTQSAASFSGDTKPGAATTADRLLFIGNSGTIFLDDIAFNDTTGSVDNSWCGDGHVYGLVPNGNGDSSQFVGSDGNSTDNYLLVDEAVSNGDTDYVESATSGNKDLYQMANLPTLPSGSTIQRVIVETRARELTAGGDQLQIGVKSGGTESWSSGIVLSTSFARQIAEFLVDPSTSAAWTESNVNSIQVGQKVP